MQFQSRRSAFSAATVQAVLDMIYVLFLLAWRVVFGKQNYSLTITMYKKSKLSNSNIQVWDSVQRFSRHGGRGPWFNSSERQPFCLASALVRKYVVYCDCIRGSLRVVTYCSKCGYICPHSTKDVKVMFLFILVNEIYGDCRLMHLQVIRPAGVAYAKA